MTNQRNVEALTALIIERGGQRPSLYPAALAEFLASRGVLVPSALTDEEAADAHLNALLISDWLMTEPYEEHVRRHRAFTADQLRTALERAAKGEPVSRPVEEQTDGG